MYFIGTSQLIMWKSLVICFAASAVLYPDSDCLSYVQENIPGHMGNSFVPPKLSWARK